MRLSRHSRQVLALCGSFLPIARAAGGDPWWEYEYEYNFVEAVILIVLVIIALVFEHAWHAVVHASHHTYRYGELHEQACYAPGSEHTDSHGNIRHTRLLKELVNRAGGEFMTLGVLAFCTFMFNNLGGFKWLAKALKSEDGDFKIPKYKEDWLHMVEVVHMKLFIGMVIYFLLVGSVVKSSVEYIKTWENCRLRRVREIDHPSASSSKNLHIDAYLHRHTHGGDIDYHQYLLWRDYFIEKVVQWKKRRPGLYKETLKKLDIDSTDEQDGKNKFRAAVEDRFAFSAYLALNVAEGVRDTIHVHQLTWLFLLVCFGIFAILHRFAEVDLFHLTWVFIGFTFLMILVMLKNVSYERKRIRGFMFRLKEKRVEEAQANRSAGDAYTFSSKGTEELIDEHFGQSVLEDDVVEEGRPRIDSPMTVYTEKKSRIKGSSSLRNIHQSVQTELYFIRFLQAILFLVSYVFARTLIDFHEWADFFTKTLLSCCLFVILFTVLVTTLKFLVPTFLALWALPPYVDEGNLSHFFAILLDDHAIHCTEDGEIVSSPSNRSIHFDALLTRKVDNLLHDVEMIRQNSPGPAVVPSEGEFAVQDRFKERESAALWAAIKKLETRLDSVGIPIEQKMIGNGIQRAHL
jgi:hypothetical protein